MIQPTAFASAPPRSLAEACRSTLEATGVDLGRARARAGFGRGHLLDVVLHVPGGSGGDAEQRAAELFVSTLLGEELFETWIGSVSAVPAVRGGPLRVLNDGAREGSTFPVEELRDAVLAARDGLLAGLPEVPLCELDGAEWTMFETTPEPAPDYAAQDDLVLATSSMPEMLKSFLSGQPFASERFSRCSERFVYLKIDQSGMDAEPRLHQRTALEDALDGALRSARLGCVVGNGLGLRYGYVDLAIVEPERALEIIRARARAHALPRRSWLLHCDTRLEASWVGLWPDSPPPPQAP